MVYPGLKICSHGKTRAGQIHDNSRNDTAESGHNQPVQAPLNIRMASIRHPNTILFF